MGGHDLKSKSINSIGNLLLPNDNYYKFEEDQNNPIVNHMFVEENKQAS